MPGWLEGLYGFIAISVGCVVMSELQEIVKRLHELRDEVSALTRAIDRLTAMKRNERET